MVVYACVQDAWVPMVDIPIYFQGLWEAMCSKCQTRLLPIHIGIMHKKVCMVTA